MSRDAKIIPFPRARAVSNIGSAPDWVKNLLGEKHSSDLSADVSRYGSWSKFARRAIMLLHCMLLLEKQGYTIEAVAEDRKTCKRFKLVQ